MNVINKIKEARRKVMDYKDKRDSDKAIRTAGELKELKERRIRAEGREKIYKTNDREKTRLHKAEMNLRKRTPTYRVIDAIKSKLKENKKRNMAKGGMGFNFMGDSNTKSPLQESLGFSFGNQEPVKRTKIKRKKGKTITINLR